MNEPLNSEEFRELIGEAMPEITKHFPNLNKMIILNKWQPIETAPDCDETKILLFYDNEIIVGHKVYKNENLKYSVWFQTEEELKQQKTEYVSGEKYFNPTHWMPLPQKPETK